MKNSTLLKKAIKLGLSICYADIETSPYLTYVYGLWKSNVSHTQIITPMQITSIGYLYEGQKKVTVKGWDDSLDKKRNFDILRNDRDKELLREVCPEIARADIILGQNSDSYDIKKLNWRLNELKLPPMKNLITLDTLKLSRKVFSPPSHKLDYRSKVYGFGGKIKQDMDDCIKTAMGDKKTQETRMKYNGKDVYDTRKIFWREVDSYILPKSIERILKEYIGYLEPFCMKCSAKKQRKLDLQSVDMSKEIRYTCLNCAHKWRVKK